MVELKYEVKYTIAMRSEVRRGEIHRVSDAVGFKPWSFKYHVWLLVEEYGEDVEEVSRHVDDQRFPGKDKVSIRTAYHYVVDRRRLIAFRKRVHSPPASP